MPPSIRRLVVLLLAILLLLSSHHVCSASIKGVDKRNRTAIFERIDENHDGKLSKIEFLKGIDHITPGRFRRLDRDDDDFLSLREFVMGVGLKHPSWKEVYQRRR